MRNPFPLLVVVASLSSAACIATSEQASNEGDDGTYEAETATTTCTVRNLLTKDCQFAQYVLTMSAPEGPRRDAVARGFSWVARGITYSKTSTFEGYRTDCSGFVSMAWQLGVNPSTRMQAPLKFDWSFALDSYADLLPGDALNKDGHIGLFAGWANAEQTAMYILQESGHANPTNLTIWTTASFKPYTPIRRNGW